MKNLKYILLLTIALFLAGSVAAQKSALHKLSKKYAKKEGFTFKEILPQDINLDLRSDDAAGIRYALDNLNYVRIIKTDDENPDLKQAQVLMDEVNKIIKEEDYDQLIMVKDGEEQVGMYMRKNDKGHVTDGVLAIAEEDEVAFIYVRGDFDMSKVGGLKNLNYLQNLGKETSGAMDNPE
jgi:hypothetical protein